MMFFLRVIQLIKMIDLFIYVQFIERILARGSEYAIREKGVLLEEEDILLWCETSPIQDDLIKNIQDAIVLIRKHNPKASLLLQKHVNNICVFDKEKSYLALYIFSTKSCFLHWKEVEAYPVSVRSRILAAALVHEAYHGECYRVFGFYAYDKSSIEKICRLREIRFLEKLIKENYLCRQELKRRIRVLSE